MSFPTRSGGVTRRGRKACGYAKAANVKTLAIFHHDPDHEDGFMEQLENDARLMWSGAVVARENMRFNLL